MTFNMGNHTLKWGYGSSGRSSSSIWPSTGTRIPGTRTGNAVADFMIGAFDNYDRVRDCRPQSVHDQAPGFIEDSYKIHPRLTRELRPAVRAVHPVRSEGGPSYHLGAGRSIDRRARRAERHPVPGRSGMPARLTNSDLNNFAPRLGVAWDVTGNARTVVRGGYGIFYQQINGETTHAAEGPWRGTTQLRQGRIEDPLARSDKRSRRRHRLAGSGAPPFPHTLACECTLYPTPIRIVYTDRTQDDLTHHVERVAAAAAHAQFRRRGLVYRQDWPRPRWP